MPRAVQINNGGALALGSVPVLDPHDFRSWMTEEAKQGGRLSSFFGTPSRRGADKSVCLYAVVASPKRRIISLAACGVEGSYDSITPLWSQAHMFEREIWEQWGVEPAGHPWLKPVRWQEPVRNVSGNARGLPCVGEFYRIGGEAVHEVMVGPIHAGIIEPGHFRFQCHGETVHHLEIALGYQHRGIEKALVGGPSPQSRHFLETAAGDTTIAHSSAYSMIVEGLCGEQSPLRANALRAVALELERMANHTGDLGALAADVGYLPASSFCGRIRGDYLNMTALLCGNRFGRSMVVPGGVLFDAGHDRTQTLLDQLEKTFRDTSTAVRLLLSTPSVLSRFEHTGEVHPEVARALGLVGPPARACSIDIDVRRDFPHGWYMTFEVEPALADGGDVLARAAVRWQEIQASYRYIKKVMGDLPKGPVLNTLKGTAENHLAVAMVEGWRGEICHVATTGPDGRFTAYKIVDSSFRNWPGLAIAMRGQQISDFPLCNKSFNLSYCGHDL
jgi:Ni,Fe-hydrogenase III large subunit